MDWIKRQLSSPRASNGRIVSGALSAILLGAPAFAAAADENVELVFKGNDQYFLIASFVFGIIALMFGFLWRSQVMRESTGDEKMQEVGAAIRDGAKAYLTQQGKTIAIFVVLLAAALFGLYQSKYNAEIGGGIAVCFILGVLASYVAGRIGMMMAVEANMRTAAAAVSSYKRSLEIAFRAGAVSGMLTVGLGLLGASLILWLGAANSMKYLVGFGFGGSLAALFMRVGGGIYTKAADVGADLVGKVEAGIPEDDPRNPAVIADNVGDNVGDCAGMAADVFESYEVTLVAAIVLGAATAAIFPTEVWMKLVLFALVARGVGVVASVIGITSVKGSDDLNSDPLKPIQRGFRISGFVAAVLTAVAAYAMMGGMGAKDRIAAAVTKEPNAYAAEEMSAIRAVAQRILDKQEKDESAKQGKKVELALSEVNLEEVMKDPAIVEMMDKAGRAKEAFQQRYVSQAILEKLPEIPVNEVTGFAKLDLNSDTAAKYSVLKPADPTQPQASPVYQSLKEAYGSKDDPLVVLRLGIVQKTPAQGADKPTENKFDAFFGPVKLSEGRRIISEAEKAQGENLKVLVKDQYPVDILINGKGDLKLGIHRQTDKGAILPAPQEITGGQPITYFKATPAEMTKRQQDLTANPEQTPKPVEQGATTNVIVSYNVAEWWRFLVCILFGIVMAFAFEMMTDYYVSTHKKPTQEVAMVSSAGPAPMIIQGFSLGLESSVFSLLAICLSLIAPLWIFPPEIYGGYLLSFYGIALVGLGLLTTTGYILAMDTFGPISDNAQGVFEMSGAGHAHPEAAMAVQRLDAAGNTTKALTKGFAIATAVVAAVALFHSFVESAKLTEAGMRLEVPEIFVGLLIGGAAPFLFSAFLINAVGRAAFQLIGEVRRQFHEDKGIMEGTSKPDYGRCVAIVTAAAQKELLGPGLLAIAFPLLVTFGLSMGKKEVTIDGIEYNLVGAQALGAFLAGTILSGQLLAVLLANSGGIWDNAKKLIEDGMHGGKGTDAHKAGVVCDTVGDPFKDTAGPALNPLIKVMNLIALLIAPIVIFPGQDDVRGAVFAVSVVMLVIAIAMTKRGSIGSEMDRMTNKAE